MIIGKALILAGALLLAAGVVAVCAPGLFHWFGRLPGDIRLQKEGSTVFIPLTSMVVVSIVLTVVLNALRRL
jgi:hypothetical protein